MENNNYTLVASGTKSAAKASEKIVSKAVKEKDGAKAKGASEKPNNLLKVDNQKSASKAIAPKRNTAAIEKNDNGLNKVKTAKTSKKSKTQDIAAEKSTLTQADTDIYIGKGVKSVIYIASECQPFISTGGLADVAGSLPKALAKNGIEVSVFIPLYRDIANAFRDKLQLVSTFTVKLAWRQQYCGVFSYTCDKVNYYFIDNEYYFGRHGLYGHYDDAERFAFFSKSVLETCKQFSLYPDVFHCNDWQTALVPIYLNTIYLEDKRLKGIKTVFTIHNIEYQGKFSIDILNDVFGIPLSFAAITDYDGSINLVKGAVQCADKVTTVSPTYAEEILTPYFAHGLHFVLNENRHKLMGILNGIDQNSYNPKNDEAIFVNYDSNSIDLKAQNKTELKKLLNLPEDNDIPLIAVITRLVSHKGIDLIASRLEQMLKERVQIIILGKGDIAYEDYFLEMQKIYSEKLRVIVAYNIDLARKIYAGSDIFLMPSKAEPCGLAQMIASRYGTVPVVRETGGLYDSIKDIGSMDGGNGFTFSNYNADDMYNRIMHAVNLFLNKKQWKNLMVKVMNVDFSWDKSAKLYIEMYNNLM